MPENSRSSFIMWRAWRRYKDPFPHPLPHNWEGSCHPACFFFVSFIIVFLLTFSLHPAWSPSPLRGRVGERVFYNIIQRTCQNTNVLIISSGLKNKCPFLDTLLFGNGHSCYGNMMVKRVKPSSGLVSKVKVQPCLVRMSRMRSNPNPCPWGLVE